MNRWVFELIFVEFGVVGVVVDVIEEEEDEEEVGLGGGRFMRVYFFVASIFDVDSGISDDACLLFIVYVMYYVSCITYVWISMAGIGICC